MPRRLSVLQPLAFTAMYLTVWGMVGLLSYGIVAAGRAWFGQQLAWNMGVRWLQAVSY